MSRDGRRWALGDHETVAWIDEGTAVSLAITAAIPPVFSAYATIELPDLLDAQRPHDAALLEVLTRHAGTREWWLGYLDTGGSDVVFPDAPRAPLRRGTNWNYVLVAAGPSQAGRWRPSEGPGAKGALPDLLFPLDRSWLISTLWDDDWTCIGGSAALVAALLAHPLLGPRTRAVPVEGDATPPGHHAI